VIGLWCRDPVESREAIEELFRRVVSDENPRSEAANWDARLPELPFYGDLGFAMLSLLGNAYRGRLGGVVQCRSFEDYGAGELWMLPYPWDVAGQRSRALAELAVRIVTLFFLGRFLRTPRPISTMATRRTRPFRIASWVCRF
jgi:hypothetical protein